MNPVDLAVWVALGLLGALVAWAIVTYNRLVRLRNRVDAVWADIEVQLKRRHDLVPNLVEVVEAYAEHEHSTLTEVTEARSRAASADASEQAAAENALTGALVRLLATVEDYPDLEAEERFQDLQTELSRLEDLIAISRNAYNLAVLAYNNNVQTVPTNLVAWLGTFTPREYLSALASETEVPEVELAISARR